MTPDELRQYALKISADSVGNVAHAAIICNAADTIERLNAHLLREQAECRRLSALVHGDDAELRQDAERKTVEPSSSAD